MQMTLFTTTAAVLWLVLWALGSKAIDAFMAGMLIFLIGAMLEILRKYLPNKDV